MRTNPGKEWADEELVAYADGELPAAQAGAIEQAAKADAAVAERIKAFQDTRRLLKAAFAPRAAEPVPQRLLDALAEPTAAGNDGSLGNVLSFPRRAPGVTRWKMYVPMAAAALVVLGVGLNANRLVGSHGAPMGVETAIANQNLVNLALETSPSGVPVAADGQEVLPLNTLRTENGRMCREFEARAGAGESLKKSRGLACREGDRQWDLRVIAAAPRMANDPAGTGYRTASGAQGPDLSMTIGKTQALSPADEQEKITKHWE